MPAEEVKELPGVAVNQIDRQLEGMPSPTLEVRRGRSLQMMAELQDGKVWRVVVVSPDYRTPEGVGVGTDAARLQRLYGPGKLLREEGAVCATFAKAPGMSFCFSPGSGPQVKNWADVVRRGLSVTAILLTGPK